MMAVRLHYYQAPAGNFGDDLNKWMWSSLMPEITFDKSSSTVLVGIGTIINDSIPEGRRRIVFGSGAGYFPPPPDFAGEGWEIACVRGTLTARALNLPVNTAITDGAILLASLPEGRPASERERSGIVFMPHVGAATTRGSWARVCRDAGIEYLDPRANSRANLERIRTAKLVLADAMHAAIVADTLRVPWIPLATSDEINSFKWLDWTSSMGLPYQPIRLPSSNLAEYARNKAAGHKRNKYFVPDLSIDNVQRWFDHMCTGHKDPWDSIAWQLYRCVDLSLKAAWPLRAYINERLHECAVETLRKISDSAGMLSSEQTFRRNTDQMVTRLDAVRLSVH